MHDNALAPPSAAVRLQLEGPIFVLLEDWRRSHEKIPSRAEALRLLIGLALAARPDDPRLPKMRRRRSALSHVTMSSIPESEAVRPTSPT
jgi:hypothetical protein